MIEKKSHLFLKFLITFLISLTSLFPQPKKIMNGAELKLALKKLNVIGIVLYIAAHPDDENTAVLSYFSSGKLMRTGYLSVTRGDGGQNLIGTEQAELLGVLRTQELLSARRIDGAEQFFTRSIDFGYTKSADETFEFWNKEKILADVVWVIRNFKPDIIITRFPSTGQGGHGQHTASAILAEEAFIAAGDPQKFPDQLKYVDVWQPKRLFWNGWLQAFENSAASAPAHLTLDLGDYNPLLGKSYTEISAESRTMHKSQGFGSSGRRGETINYFFLTDGEPVSGNYPEGEGNLLENIDLSWNRIKGGAEIGKILKEADEKFNPENPSNILPLLLDAYKLMNSIEDEHFINVKKRELAEVIRSSAGIWIEAAAADYTVIPGNPIEFNVGVTNRTDYPFKLKGIVINKKENFSLNNDLFNGEIFDSTFSYLLPVDINYSQPYWLKGKPGKGIFNVEDQLLIGKPENDPPVKVDFILEANDVDISFTTPVLYKWTDPVNGEQYRPLEITPPVTIKTENKLYIFPDDNEKNISITLKNHADKIEGQLKLVIPGGWKSEPELIDFSLNQKNEEKVFNFLITPPEGSSEAEMKIQIETESGTYANEMVTINYSHIPIQTFFPEAEIKLVKINTEKVVNNIGYIMGSGDDIPDYLSQLGYNIEIINNFNGNNLNRFDAVIAGIRAYNTKNELEQFQTKLMDYVYNGGTLIIQYNTDRGLVTENLGPFPLKLSRERVSVEDAPIKFLNVNHPLLNFPNKISQNDFDNWVQERGLYFANEWDPNYQTIIASNDPGEALNEGGMLYANYGKGVFIYTGYSWFRQLPAGVPGAYRLFVNLISAGHPLERSN